MTIQTGRGEGLLPWSSLKWASQRYASTEKGRLIRHKRPIQRVVQAGDVIWVQRTKRRTPKQLPHYSLEQIPVVQGAFVAIDPRTHSVRALVGGWHPISHPFNRALWSKRQPGSTFKPILYTAALASRQFTPATLVNDTYLEMNVNGKRWIPTNANRSYRNKAIRLRDALAFSVNTVAVRVLDRISPYRTIAMARKLGIRAPLTLKPSLALGASAVQPLALVNAYATIAGRGMYDDPVMITRILTHNGQTIYNRLPNPRRAISPSVAFLMTSMLQDVVQKGTAKRARVLARPIAGKTGTTNDARNAWFVGYTPEICAGVWIGFDDQTPLGRRESGASAALPVFIDWMKQYHKTPSGYRPPSLFRVPDGITHVKIDPETGELAPIHQTDYLFEAFLDGTEPTRYARNQGPLANPRDFIRE
jgi:penicillin-binding protein 1A